MSGYHTPETPYASSPFADDNPFADAVSMGSSTLPTQQQQPQQSSSTPFSPSASSTKSQLTENESQSQQVFSAGATPTSGRKVQSLSKRSTTSRISHGVSSRLENLDLDAGPLGPLGSSAQADVAEEEEEAERPQLPSKDTHAPVHMKSPPSQYTPSSSTSTASAGAVPLEQLTALPTFTIYVGDPHKIGDLTSAHIVYRVHTKTTSKAYKQEDFVVNRRYRDFLWLYNNLNSDNPGIVVPPPPDKQAVGRFHNDFVEGRRYALERMINKIASHPTLQRDGNLKIFLESEAFNTDVKSRERQTQASQYVPSESKGLMSNLGFGGSAFSGKYVERDEWFERKKEFVDTLETQLKGLAKTVDMLVKQRKALAESTGDFGEALQNLSLVELDRSLGTSIASLADLQLRIRELHDRQAMQDVLTLGNTVDEYLRTVASIKLAFAARQKVYLNWQAAEMDLQKRKSTSDKLRKSGKTQHDRAAQVDAELSDAERRVHQLHLDFEESGKVFKQELARFDQEKIEDFKASVETFLEATVEGQKQLIELWETCLMQLNQQADIEQQQSAYIETKPVIKNDDINIGSKDEVVSVDQEQQPPSTSTAEPSNGDAAESSPTD